MFQYENFQIVEQPKRPGYDNMNSFRLLTTREAIQKETEHKGIAFGRRHEPQLLFSL